MEFVSPVFKLAGSTIWMNIKFQLTPNSYVREWRKAKERLESRYRDVERTLQSQLRGIGKVLKMEVQCWLQDVRSTLESDDDRRGCFCSTAPQARHAYEGTLRMMMLIEEGERFMNSGMDLVIEDFSITIDHYMSKIQKICAELQQLKRDVERTLQQQLQFGKIVKDEVHVWLENVNKNLETAQVDEGDPVTVQQMMQRKVGELRKLCDDGKKYTADSGVILVKDDPSSVKRVLPLLSEQCYGRDGALRKVLECLRGDQVRRLAVWGMGGIGKTTMMAHVYNTLLSESIFDQLIWVTISLNLNIYCLQNEIAMRLTNRPLEEEDPTRRAVMLHRMLQQGSYLLILDDVWEAFPDEEVGIPSTTNSRFKLVLTTRSVSVARYMGCDVIIKLEPLSGEEALQLFLNTVGTAVLSGGGTIKPDLEPTLLQMVSECGGLPLAIRTVARAMRGISDQDSWMKALKGMKSSKRNQDLVDEVLVGVTLRFSYDSLEDKKLQHCFLYCALYPKYFEIPKEELIEYWIEEGYIDQMETRYDMICEGREILRKLQDRRLLECIEPEVDQDVHAKLRITGSDSERVKMHDLHRDMALNIMRESPLVSVKSGLSEEELQEKEDWPVQVEKVSLMRNGMEEIPLPQTHLKSYNMLTTLLMPNNRIETIPESFFMQMPGLKVLDLSWNRTLRCLPDSISSLENLTTLLLQACESLRKVPSLSKCQRITKLDLSWSGIKQVPDGMEMLGNLKYLDLRAPQLGKIPQGVLPQLSNLQHLLAMEMEAEEVVALSKLEYLQGTVGNLDEMSTVLESMQNQVKRLRIHTLDEEEPWLALFLDTDMDGNLVLFLDDKLILGDLYTTVGGDDDRDLGCVNRVLANDALSLRVLSIQALENIERVFCLAFNPLQTLTLLRLVELDNLTSVFDENGLGLLSASPPASYSAAFPLSSIIIKDCPALKNVFPSAHLLGYLQNLQHIEVTDCKEMEEIVAASTSEGGGQEKLALPRLKTMKLNDLPSLKSICSGNSVLICDSLETLEIRDCEELKRIPLYDAETSALKTITVDSEEWWKASEWCHPNATDILLPKCVFSNDDYDEALEEITLPKLKTVELSDLPAWKGIRSSSKVLSSTGSLEICEITDCPKLKRNSSLVSSVRFSGAGNEFELNDSKNRSKEQKIRKKVKIYRRRN